MHQTPISDPLVPLREGGWRIWALAFTSVHYNPLFYHAPVIGNKALQVATSAYVLERQTAKGAVAREEDAINYGISNSVGACPYSLMPHAITW
jgi:hypothetical protein